MTTLMDPEARRSRRALLVASAGGLAALVAQALSRPPLVRAGTDGDVVLDQVNVATSETSIVNNSTTDVAFAGMNFSGTGLRGYSNAAGNGVYGESISSDGVVGRSGDSAHSGVWGLNSGLGYGVSGSTAGATTAGVWGSNSGGGRGVSGTSPSGDGVVGESGASTHSGVRGNNTAGGRGVLGASSSGVGIEGDTSSGVGVYGSGYTGVGVRAASQGGDALQVRGRASFSRSGRASVAIGSSYVDVTVPGGLGSSANVLATLQYPRSGVWVTACRRNYPTAGTVRIYLSKVASTAYTTPVAWFVFG